MASVCVCLRWIHYLLLLKCFGVRMLNICVFLFVLSVTGIQLYIYIVCTVTKCYINVLTLTESWWHTGNTERRPFGHRLHLSLYISYSTIQIWVILSVWVYKYMCLHDVKSVYYCWLLLVFLYVCLCTIYYWHTFFEILGKPKTQAFLVILF